MADRLYEYYEGVYLQQAEQFEEAAVAGLRAAIGGFSREYLKILRSVTVPRQPSSNLNANGNSSSSNQQPLARAQEEIESVRESTQRQLATALANGFGALANLPLPSPTRDSFASQATVSGTSNQGNVEQEVNKADDTSISIKCEPESEMVSTANNQLVLYTGPPPVQANLFGDAADNQLVLLEEDFYSEDEVKGEIYSDEELMSENEGSFRDDEEDYSVFDDILVKSEDISDWEDGDTVLVIEAVPDMLAIAIEDIPSTEDTANEQVDNSSDNTVKVEEQDNSQALDLNAIDEQQQSDAETVIDEESVPEAASSEPVQSTAAADLDSLPSSSTDRRRSTRAKKKVANYTSTTVSYPATSNGSRRSTRPKKEVNYASPLLDDSFIRRRVNFVEKTTKRKCSSSEATPKKTKQSHLLVKEPTIAAPSAGTSQAQESAKYSCILVNCGQSFVSVSQLHQHLNEHAQGVLHRP